MTTTGAITPEYAYRQIDEGELSGLALVPISSGIDYGELYATIGVMRGGRGDQFIAAVFIDDYVSAHHFPRYEGSYKFTTQDILFLRVFTQTAATIRLSATVHHEGYE